MPTVRFIADLHLGHKNLMILRNNMNIEDHDKMIINNWNKVVTSPKDITYIVGDLTMESKNLLEQYISQLRGIIIVIGGNHDNKQCCEKLKSLGITVMGCLQYKGFIITHIPIHPSQLDRFRGNIHGHIHNDFIQGEKAKLYLNISSEKINYTPITFDDLLKQYNFNLNSTI